MCGEKQNKQAPEFLILQSEEKDFQYFVIVKIKPTILPSHSPHPPLYKICLKKKYKELKVKHKQVKAGEVDEGSFIPCYYLDLEDFFSVIEFLIQSNT